MKKLLYILFLVSSVSFGQLGMSVGTVANGEVSADAPEITIGNTSNTGRLEDQATSITLSHTCAANTEMLVVTISAYETVTLGSTGATYNGVAMTEQIGVFEGGDVDGGIYIFTLANPTTGSAQDIVWSFSTANLNNVVVSAIDLEVTSGSISVDVTSSVNNVTTGDPTVDITTVASNTVIIDVMYTKANSPYSVGTGQTEVSAIDLGTSSSGTSYKIETSSGTKTMYWDNTGVDEIAKSGAVSFKSEN